MLIHFAFGSLGKQEKLKNRPEGPLS